MKRTVMRVPLVALWGLLMLAEGGCATKPRAAEGQVTPPPKRDKRSTKERLANMPGLDQESSPENQEERFGHEANREQKEQRRQQGASPSPPTLPTQGATQPQP